MSHDGFLGRALMDPATGLPNVPYFRLIRDWEERRARRRKYAVQVVKVTVEGGDERTRRTLSWRLCNEMRDSDLVASQGSGHFRILLTSPDAENAGAICRRLGAIAGEVNTRHPSEHPVAMHITLDGEQPPRQSGPCDPCDERLLADSGEGPVFQPPLAKATNPDAEPEQ